MSDILDSYISKIDSGKFIKKINNYILKLRTKKDKILRIGNLKFEVLKIKLELKRNYFNLGKFISNSYDKEKVVDFSYKEDFFYLNHEISKKKRFIKRLKSNMKK